MNRQYHFLLGRENFNNKLYQNKEFVHFNMNRELETPQSCRQENHPHSSRNIKNSYHHTH